jgi:3-oxoacyl-[acyl-carrier-protein] synthase II
LRNQRLALHAKKCAHASKKQDENMNDARRVVITGIGVVSPIGVGKKAFWTGLLEGKSGVKKISSFDASTYPTQIAGEVRDFDPIDFMSHKDARRMDRSSQMILAAAMMAVEDADIKFGMDMSSVGVFTGTAVGGQAWAFREYDVFREKGIRRINPFTAISTFPNASSAHISLKFGCKGPSDTISSGCVSSTVALGYALDNLRMGHVDVAFVGGTEAPLSPGLFGAYCAAHVMTPEVDSPTRVPRPFDLYRNGIVLSEGAAVLICETLGHAIQRQARIYAEVGGWSHNSDSYSMMMLNPDGVQAKSVMCAAIANARISFEQIDYVQAHAPGAVADDKIEAAALRDVFGVKIGVIPVVSIKSMMGHTQGACGVIEAAAAALSIHMALIPRSINCDTVDPSCALRINRCEILQTSIQGMLLNTFGFGGKNSSIVLRSIN